MKVSLVDLLYLGEMLFITPAIRVLMTAMPDAEIDVLMNASSLSILQHHPL